MLLLGIVNMELMMYVEFSASFQLMGLTRYKRVMNFFARNKNTIISMMMMPGGRHYLESGQHTQ